MNNTDYHKPVMLAESIEGLNINPDGIYVDVTFGGGGHASEILNKLSSKGKLLAFDQDPDSFANSFDDERFILIKSNFRYLKNYLDYHEVTPVDGILADLGVSSYQFDNAEKGFSIRKEGPLDLRMNPEAPVSAAVIVNKYQKEQLIKIFRQYGEVKNAPFLAQQIALSRKEKEIITTTDLIQSIKKAIPRRKENQFLAQVFQALRIEVNQELEALKEMLESTPKVLKNGGRLVVIAYHSLEDRLAKNFIKAGNFEGVQEKDFYGNVISPFKSINKKPMTASEAELLTNNRARSARLRVAEKTKATD
ncbi:MAG TPA: 16S rRNA (cytosine(1402)-N(4))-methyltransferase RsmH [Bacteroidales bacterium]|nr:16S rRNA (cytosine(1402)-N(4))-methyltransferase RsmH [Bacteroidales bacterium]